MADPDFTPLSGVDPQDVAEVFDETHLDDEGDGDALLDELEDVFDATRAHDAALPSRLTPHETTQSDAHRRLSAQADALLEQKSIEDDDSEDAPVSDQEIPLVYVGLMRNQPDAEGAASQWEGTRASDGDREDRGRTAH